MGIEATKLPKVTTAVKVNNRCKKYLEQIKQFLLIFGRISDISKNKVNKKSLLHFVFFSFQNYQQMPVYLWTTGDADWYDGSLTF